MSYYYNYYIGYMAGKKIYPLGPYSANGKLKTAVCKSRSFASDLHDDLDYVSDDMISDELRKEFEYTDYNGEKVMPDLRYMKVSDLKASTPVRRGYFLIKDVMRFEENHGDFDGFYDVLSPEVYAAKAHNEMIFGKPLPEKDIEGEEYQPTCAADYMYYAFVDYTSKEYESFIIREVAEMLDDYDSDLPKDRELVVIETEG